jgi:hypothetical protein
LRLLKVAAHVTASVRRVLIRLPRAFPLAHIFFAVARDLENRLGSVGERLGIRSISNRAAT